MSLVNAKAAQRAKARAYLRAGAGGFFSFMFGSMIKSTDNTSNKILSAFLLFWFVLLLLSGIKMIIRLNGVYRLDAVLSGAEANRIKLSALSEATGIKEKRLQRRLLLYIKKKYFTNCTVETEGEPALVIQAGEEAPEDVVLECPSCGTEFTAKNGAVARCPECAVIINLSK